MERLPIILDTDPGLDDAIAIAVLTKYAADRLDTVITSYGNVSCALTTDNLLRCCNLFDIAPFVIKGSSHPLTKTDFADASHIHGSDGLAGVHVPKAELSVTEHRPIDILAARIKAHEKVDYISLGPLTNLAKLLTQHPDVRAHINRVYTMGGGIAFGNITKYAEFNIYCDPHAAKTVFDANLPQTVIPLDTTHQIVLSMDEIDRLTRTRSMKSGWLRQILVKNHETNLAQGEAGCILHDATAVLAALFPSIFEYKAAAIAVVTEGEHIGQTVLSEGSVHTVTQTADRKAVIEYLALAAQ